VSGPSLRALAGVAPCFAGGGPLAVERTALLLIDYQQAYRSGPLALPGEAAASAVARRLRDWAGRIGQAVIHVHHRLPAGAPLFAEGTPAVEALAGLAPGAGETLIVKRQPSAFAGTGLADRLRRDGVGQLLIAGYMTHNCVDSTAREAFHRGWPVGIVADACATRDLAAADGRPLAAATVQAAVLAGLADRIAEVVDYAGLASLSAATA
jgi:nicotinamidase-related amidase